MCVCAGGARWLARSQVPMSIQGCSFIFIPFLLELCSSVSDSCSYQGAALSCELYAGGSLLWFPCLPDPLANTSLQPLLGASGNDRKYPFLCVCMEEALCSKHPQMINVRNQCSALIMGIRLSRNSKCEIIAGLNSSILMIGGTGISEVLHLTSHTQI